MESYWSEAIEQLKSHPATPNSLSETVQELYLEIHQMSIHFHRDFIKARDTKIDPSIIHSSMNTILNALKLKLKECLEDLPYDDSKYGSKDAFTELLMDVIVASLLRRQSDLGAFTVMLQALEINDR